jgi:hypothetical protein
VECAAALIDETALFDAEWYADRCGRRFADRTDAITDYVVTHGADGTPHPLFADRWLYRRDAWQGRSPDPLSDYLSHEGPRSRSPHPLIDIPTLLASRPGLAGLGLGPVDGWLRQVTDTTPLPARVGEATLADVRAAAQPPPPLRGVPTRPTAVLLLPPALPNSLHLAVAWQRHLHRLDVTSYAATPDPGVGQLLAAVAASLVGVETIDHDASLRPLLEAVDVVVVLRPTLRPASWPWLPALVQTLIDPDVSIAQAVLVGQERTVSAAGADWADGTRRPFLAGHPVADAARVSDTPPAGPWPGVTAFRARDLLRARPGLTPGTLDEVELATALPGRTRIATGAVVPGTAPRSAHRTTEPPPAAEPDATTWQPTALREPGVLTVAEGRRTLRWAIDTAGPFRDDRWGDLHFARSLAEALGALGQHVAVDHPESRGRASRELDDVVLVLRGLGRVDPQPGALNLLWVISHPDAVDATEVAGYDATFAAGPSWARERSLAWGLRIDPLLQCTDGRLFHPGLAEPETGPGLLFVGNRRGADRPAVRESLAAGLPVHVVGAGWEGIVEVDREYVENSDLGALYESAGVVLNDHWPDMAAAGFVSNRVFDVLATGARLVTDEVTGLADLFPSVPVFHTAADLTALMTDREHAFPDRPERLALAGEIARDHTFSSRAATLLDTALARLPA